MTLKNDSYEKLHSLIEKAENFASAIFYDVKYNIDQQAFERTEQRLNLISSQYGIEAVYGILGNWAMKITSILRKEATENSIVSPTLVAYIPQDLNFKDLDLASRAKVSATQFIVAVSNDDLEMAEAIYLAACNSSIEDAAALVSVVLNMFVRVFSTYVSQ